MKRKPNYNSIKRTEGGHIFNNQFIKAFGRLPAVGVGVDSYDEAVEILNDIKRQTHEE